MLTRGLIADSLRPAFQSFAAVSAFAAVVAGIGALWSAGVAPDARTWLALVGLAVPTAWTIAAPAAGAVGIAAAIARWADEGAWAGARAVGVAGRRLLPAALAVGVAAATLALACTLVIEPWARREARRVAADAVGAAELVPGQPVSLGSAVLRPTSVDGGVARDVFVAAGRAVGTAASARLVAGATGPAVELRDGVLAGDGWRVRFSRWSRPLPPPHSPRLELSQRSNRELRELIARTEADGRDAAYERAVLYKRALHPLATLLLPLAVLPFGASRRPGAGVAVATLGYLVAVRVGDQLAATIGAWPAAATGPAFVALLAVAAWAWWSDR